MSPRNQRKQQPSERAQRTVAALVWGLVGGLLAMAVAVFIDLPLWFGALIVLVTGALLAWGMDRKYRLEQQQRNDS